MHWDMTILCTVFQSTFGYMGSCQCILVRTENVWTCESLEYSWEEKQWQSSLNWMVMFWRPIKYIQQWYNNDIKIAESLWRLIFCIHRFVKGWARKKSKTTWGHRKECRYSTQILLECPSVCVDRLTSKVTFLHMHELAYIIWIDVTIYCHVHTDLYSLQT